MTICMPWPRSMALALCVAVLAGCSKPTYYRPAENGFGYGEQKIGEARYQVAFGGNHMTRRETAHQYVLFRAAQLADRDGYDYVAINDQSQRIERYGDLRDRPTERVDRGLEDGGGSDDSGRRNGDGRVRSTVERYQAILDVSFYHERGDVPAEVREVYATDEVLAGLGKSIEFESGPPGGDYITNQMAK